MELYKREFFISRIRSGYIPVKLNNKRFLVYHPSNDILLEAQELYIEAHDLAIEEELFDDDDILTFLIAAGLWSDTKETELEKTLPEHIEYWKIELYNNVLKSNTQATIRKYLTVAKEEYAKAYSLRHSLDHLTCAGYASYIKNMFIISKSTRYKKKPVNWQAVDLNQIMNLYHQSLLDADTIRMLSRSHPWTNMWQTFKVNGKIFQNTNLTVEQQSLISWSIMYDRIYESPDCPTEAIIEDDDMLDGWLLVQKRHREAQKNKQAIESSLSSKLGNADDVFLMAETVQDAKKIALLNTDQANRVKEQRIKEAKMKGEVLEQQLSDVKMKRSMQIRQAYVNQVKGR
jgi:hypothetical protein